MSDRQIADFNQTISRITLSLTLLMAGFLSAFVYKVQTEVAIPGELGVSF